MSILSNPVFYPIHHDGFYFEKNSAQPHQIIPSGSQATVKLMGAPGVVPTSMRLTRPYTYENDRGNIARWSENGIYSNARTINLNGADHGHVYYRVEGFNSAFLHVHVKRPKPVRVSFYFVSDIENHSTYRSKGIVERAIRGMNRILTPQTNIHFSIGYVRDLVMNEDMGCLIGSSENVAHHDMECGKIVKYADPGSDFNVFFVWDMRSPASDDDVLAINWKFGKSALVDDFVTEDQMAQVLAHEYCHSQGCRHVDGKRHLMYEHAEEGTLLTFEQVELLNPSYA